MTEQQVRVVVPFVEGKLRPETQQALDGFMVDYVDVGGSDEAYYQLLRGLWAEGRTFAVVEQDIVPTPDQLQELLECEQHWCMFGYRYRPVGLTVGLGCTKFSADLMRDEPQAMETIGALTFGTHPPRHWCSLDSLVQTYFLQSWTKHVHRGLVRHLGESASCTCFSPERSGNVYTAGELAIIDAAADPVEAAAEVLWSLDEAATPAEREAAHLALERAILNYQTVSRTVLRLRGLDPNPTSFEVKINEGGRVVLGLRSAS